MGIEIVFDQIKSIPDCIIYPPTGVPIIEANHILPQDLMRFYVLCGGMDLYRNADYAVQILSPEKVKRANPIIIGSVMDLPINGIEKGHFLENWYVIAHDFNGDYLSIDLNPVNNGVCYDSHHELHPGNSPVIANSFTELLGNLVLNQGKRFYWL